MATSTTDAIEAQHSSIVCDLRDRLSEVERHIQSIRFHLYPDSPAWHYTADAGHLEDLTEGIVTQLERLSELAEAE